MSPRYRVRLEAPTRRDRTGWAIWVLALALISFGAVVATLIVLGESHVASGQVVARVGATEITVQDLKAEARAQGRASDAALTSDLLDAVIDRTLLAQEAERRGLERLASFPSDRRRAEAQLLAGSLLHRLPTPPAPTPEQIAAYISAHPEAYADRKRLVLDELRFPLVGAPELQNLTLEEAQAQLLAAKVRFVAFQATAFTGILAPALERAVLSAGGDHVAIVRDGMHATAVRLAASEPAPLLGLSAELSARSAFADADRERRMAELVRRLKVQTPPRLLFRFSD